MKKERVKRTSINRINQFLEMPEELITNKPKLTILGFDQLVIENYKNISYEVEIFENKYKKMRRDSLERKKKIKSLLMGNKNSKGNINLLKQQLVNIQKNIPIQFEETEYIDKNNLIKKMNISMKKENILNDKENNINKINNNRQYKTDKTSTDELNIDSI